MSLPGREFVVFQSFLLCNKGPNLNNFFLFGGREESGGPFSNHGNGSYSNWFCFKKYTAATSLCGSLANKLYFLVSQQTGSGKNVRWSACVACWEVSFKQKLLQRLIANEWDVCLYTDTEKTPGSEKWLWWEKFVWIKYTNAEAGGWEG